MKKILSGTSLLILLIVFGGIGIRLIKYQTPPLDVHAFRQLRSLALARKYFYNTSLFLQEELRIKANYLGSQFEIMEPPILESIVAGIYLIFGKEIPYSGRIVNILLWCFSSIFLYDLARKISNPLGGIFAILYYLFLPFSVIESRTIMPNPLMVSSFVISLWVSYQWIEKLSWKWTILAGISVGITILIKVFAVYHLVIPIGLLLLKKHDNLLKLLTNNKVWSFFGICCIFPFLYYFFIPDRSAGNYLTTWTINYLNMLIDPYFYLRWLHVLNGEFGLIYILAGLALSLMVGGNKSIFLTSLNASYFLFGITLPSLIITHTYYSLPLIPIVALSLAPLGLLIENVVRTKKVFILILVFIFGIGLTYNAILIRKQLYANSYDQEPQFWQTLSSILPNDGKIIGLCEDYNMRMNYYGWRFIGYYPYSYDLDMGSLSGGGYDPLHIDWRYFLKYTEGYDYFLVTELSQFTTQPYLRKVLYEYFPIVEEGERFILFDLRNPIQPLPIED